MKNKKRMLVMSCVLSGAILLSGCVDYGQLLHNGCHGKDDVISAFGSVYNPHSGHFEDQDGSISRKILNEKECRVPVYLDQKISDTDTGELYNEARIPRNMTFRQYFQQHLDEASVREKKNVAYQLDQEKANAEYEKKQEAYYKKIDAYIQRHGYTGILYKRGLLHFIEDIQEGVNIDGQINRLVEINTRGDEYFTITQVIDDNTAMSHLKRGNIDISIIFKNGNKYGATFIQGAYVYNVAHYFAFKGVKTYTTVLGASQQAFVFEPVFTDGGKR